MTAKLRYCWLHAVSLVTIWSFASAKGTADCAAESCTIGGTPNVDIGCPRHPQTNEKTLFQHRTKEPNMALEGVKNRDDDAQGDRETKAQTILVEFAEENANNATVAIAIQQQQRQQEQQQKQSSKQVSDLLQVFGIEPSQLDPKDTAGFEAKDMPSIIDILGRLPPATSMISQAKQNSSQGMKVAVCSTGHLRTFSLPGMYSSLSNHLLHTAPDSADLYLVGHLGEFRGSGDAQATVEMDGPAAADDVQLAQSLAYLELSSDHVEHTSGDCTALKESWLRDGITGRVCRDNGNFMQMMWLDHCVHVVRSSGKQYDLLVRMRPDVGIFQPFPWDTISRDRVTYMQKDAGGKVDWFFTVPWSTIDTWWDPIAAMYANGFAGLPDYSIFSHSEMLVERNFPVVIVRGVRSAQCWRIVTSFELESDCEQKTGAGFWEQLHS